MENLIWFVSLVTFVTCFLQVYSQGPWSSEEYQDVINIPCYGQEMKNGSFHVGQIQYNSENIYNYDQKFEGNSDTDLDCTFNGPSSGAGMGSSSGPYNWNIDRIDIISSGGINCLGGGVGFPWYRFRVYGRSYVEYQASIWITWREQDGQLLTNPVYLVQCVYEGTNLMAIPINYVF